MSIVFCQEFNKSAFMAIQKQLTKELHDRADMSVRARGDVLLKIIFSLPQRPLPGVLFRLKIENFLSDVERFLNGDLEEKQLFKYGVGDRYLRVFKKYDFDTKVALSVLRKLFLEYWAEINRLDDGFFEVFQKGLQRLGFHGHENIAILKKISGTPFFKIDYGKSEFPLGLDFHSNLAFFEIKSMQAKFFLTHPLDAERWERVQENADHGKNTIYNLDAPLFMFLVQKGNKSFISLIESNKILSRRGKQRSLDSETRGKLAHVEEKLLQLYGEDPQIIHEKFYGSPLYFKSPQELLDGNIMKHGKISGILSSILAGRTSKEIFLLFEKIFEQAILIPAYCRALFLLDFQTGEPSQDRIKALASFYQDVIVPLSKLRSFLPRTPFLQDYSFALFFATLVGCVNFEELGLISKDAYKKLSADSALSFDIPEVQEYDNIGTLLCGKQQEKELIFETSTTLGLLFPAEWARNFLSQRPELFERALSTNDKTLLYNLLFLVKHFDIKANIWAWDL